MQESAQRPDLVIRCSDCEHSFDAMDGRALVFSKRGSGSNPLCPLCATILRSSQEWAIWNNCNGVFEVFPRRAGAQVVAKLNYKGADVTVIPVRTFVEPEDNHWHRHKREDELDKRRA